MDKILNTRGSAMSAPLPRQNRGWGPTGAALSPDPQTRYEVVLIAGSDGGWRAVGRKSMAGKTNFQGSCFTLVTPFKKCSLDAAAVRGLEIWQIAEGTHGLVPVGTTGESPTVNHDE